MRIIHGKFKGFQFPSYQGSNTRPSTDLAKESLFNTLSAYFDIEAIKVIDIFAGTGNIGLECISRGASSLISIDSMPSNIRYMQDIRKKLSIENWDILKMDALAFVDSNTITADLVFADPPYDYPSIHEFVNRVLNSAFFNTGNPVFVLEHVDRLVFNHKEVFLKKKYGNTSFTCFRNKAHIPTNIL